MGKTILVIDCVYDFIDGSLACEHAEEAVQNIISYINTHKEDKVLYVREVHPANHCSFIEQGGMWPPHAVEGTRGAQLHQDFYEKVQDIESRPTAYNVFIKGTNPALEQYSGFEGISIEGKKLSEMITDEVEVMGIATEYCVLNTINDLVAQGIKVHVLEEGLGYVTLNGHQQTIEALKERGLI